MAPISTTSVQNKSILQDNLDMLEEITTTHRNSPINDENEASSDSFKSLERSPADFEPIKLNFAKKFHNKSGKMTREELEEILLQKIVEAMVYKTKVAEYRSHQERYEIAIESFLDRIVNLEKQYYDLQLAHNDVMQKIREYQTLGPQMREIEPIKVIRAVGLQVISITSSENHQPIVIPDSPEPPRKNKKLNQKNNNNLNTRGQKRKNNDENDQNNSKRQKKNQEVVEVDEINEIEKQKTAKTRKSTFNCFDIGNNSTIIENDGKISDSCLDDTIMAETTKNHEKNPITTSKTPEKMKNNKNSPKVAKTVQNKEIFKAPKSAAAKTVTKKSSVATQALLNTSMSSECSFMSDATFSKFDPTVNARMTSTPVKKIASAPENVNKKPPVVVRKPSEIREIPISLVDKKNIKIPTLPLKPKQAFPSMNNSLKKPPARPILNVEKKTEGIKLTWNMNFKQKDHSDIKKYQLYAFNHKDECKTENWNKIGDIDPLLLPMAVILGFNENVYHFAIRVEDVEGRIGDFSEPKTWN
ncbi:hypothetical protein PVAND_014662 [Polypedilum vanderplanki]|uniref:Activating transcription factor 7-interacting protein Fn3 domain-containing protein n=1 Tax=Polypedilum vanderplanki TaxID=319348 RepID=A0A9J6BAL4_POLVA|nr:hypothetical protein PVAND_014662 [Polypedilum vanderplanki]